MTAPLELSVVRIYSNSGKVIGAGFLSQKYILTCAHVIADALGLPRKTTQMPDAEITLDFPLVAAKQLFKAKVVFWLPVNPDVEVEDIAGLELKHSPPNQASLAPLITSDDWAGHPLRVLGFPAGQPDGVWATGVLRGRTAKGWVQLEDVKQPEQRRFVEQVLTAVNHTPNFTLVLTLRADFLGYALSNRPLADALQGELPLPNPILRNRGGAICLLGPMNRQELQDAIENYSSQSLN